MSQVNEISKGTIGSYLKKTPASAAQAGNKMAGQGMNPTDNMKKGVKGIVKRSKGVSMAVDKMTGKAKVPATESFVIPEEIPANERTAFHGAAAAAAKSGKKSFNFGGKTHPVTMKKDTANAIADQKESMDDNDDKEERIVTMKKNPKKKSGETATMNPKLGNNKDSKSTEMEQKESLTIRDKLMMVLEGDRSKHYKGATEPESMDNNLKGAGAKKMKADIQGNAADPDLEKKSHDDATKAGRAGPSRKMRSNDNMQGDKKAQTPEDLTKKGQGSSEVKESRDQLSGIKAAYAEMQNGN